MPRRPTISDVAVRAGVSPATGSRWLNGRIELPESTGDRIRIAVADLTYYPHAQARRLSSGKAEVIGIILPDIANPFFVLLAGEAERVAVAVGYDVVIWSTRNKVERELACFDRLASGYADGLILITKNEDDGCLAARIRSARDRVVIIDENVPGTDAPKFFVDNELGGYGATRHLLDHGHKLIAHIGRPMGVMSAIERAAGWRRALTESGNPPPDGWHIASEYEIEPARADARALFHLSPMPTSVFAGSEAIALGVMYAASERGLEIPVDLSLVGFDCMPINGLFGPPLTTIEQPIAQLGRLGAERLLSLIVEPEAPRSKHRVQRLPVKLAVRNSVAAPAGTQILADPRAVDRPQEIDRVARRTRR